MKERDARISELETALAAAQHNYESVMDQLEERATEKARTKKVDTSSTVIEARARAEDLVKEAETRAAQIVAEAEEAATATRNDALEHAAQAKERVDDEAAAAQSEYKARLDEAEARLAAAEKRAAQVETDRRKLEDSINQLTARAEAERRELIADAEAMVTEAVAKAQADRDQMLEEARAQLRGQLEDVDGPPADATEAASLRNQVSQLRTTVRHLQDRLADAANLSVEELQLASDLADLDLETAEVVNLRDYEDDEQEPRVKSKWAHTADLPAGSLQSGRSREAGANNGSGAAPQSPTWRDTVDEPDNSEEAPVALGFYERRLAGLRERLNDAYPEDA